MSKTKNWINFCGVSSESIKGLLINELPPVQMPPKRIKKIEIEGRDGDIIEELGYMAYDRTAQISLTDGYDIDEIISWLNNSGPVIFSNEPEKVYTAAVYDAVVFERLTRFRKASVKFHVQPFKIGLNDVETLYSSTGSFNNACVVNAGNIFSQPIIETQTTSTDALELNINGDYIRLYFDVEEAKYYNITFNLAENIFTVKDNEGVAVDLKKVVIDTDDFLKLQPGENNVSLWRVGGLSSDDIGFMKIQNGSRWL